MKIIKQCSWLQYSQIYILKISSKIWLVGIKEKSLFKKNYKYIILFLMLFVSTVLSFWYFNIAH